MPFDADAPPEVTARDRMIYLRDFLAALPPARFNMCYWDDERPDCGTTHCIGGWTEVLFTDRLNISKTNVGALIGLTPEQAENLFFPEGPETKNGTDASFATLPQAIAVLDHFLATGEIDWGVA